MTVIPTLIPPRGADASPTSSRGGQRAIDTTDTHIKPIFSSFICAGALSSTHHHQNSGEPHLLCLVNLLSPASKGHKFAQSSLLNRHDQRCPKNARAESSPKTKINVSRLRPSCLAVSSGESYRKVCVSLAQEILPARYPIGVHCDSVRVSV